MGYIDYKMIRVHESTYDKLVALRPNSWRATSMNDIILNLLKTQADVDNHVDG